MIAVVPSYSPRVQLTQQQIDELRAQIERGFQDLPGVRIRPTQDTAETLSFLSGGSSTEASIRNYLKKAKDVTALIRFTPVKLSDGGNPTVSVRMRAITLKFSCSGVVDMRLPLLGKTLQDVDGVFESFARAFYSRNRATTVVAPAFRHRKGEQSECNILLQNRLVAALTSLRPAAINGRPATIRREPPNRPPNAKPDRGLVIIEGTYFYRRDPGKKGTRLWISLGAHRGGDILEQMPEVEVRKPHCNPLPLDFFQIIRNGAKSNKGKLNVFTKGQFRVDDDAVITVFSFTSRPVYCWYINPERTAYILTPNPRQQGRLTTEREITREFPRDFGLPPQRFSQVSNDMFGCFLPPRDISATEAHKRWMSLWGAKELSEAQIFEMLDRMRAIPGMVEDYADIVIINKK
ncbi:MAG: hypothetical protein KDJ36_09675 [Hyphomicrobiaceae bacterium]|nr:hypothetical protein [Hyphomicrobiaceae bacterium]